MKQLSARWAAAVFLTPALIVIAILVIGVGSREALAGNGKGNVQVAFTAIINNSINDLTFQSVQLNVISVRLNAAKGTATVTDASKGWQTIGVPTGVTAGQTNTNVVYGTNFGPNGNTVGIGQGRAEMALNLSTLQGSIQLFNIAKIKAQTYNWLELVLDPTTPGSVISQCSNISSAGEGCISYPLQFASGTPSIILPLASNSTTTTPITVTANSTFLLPLAISVQLGSAPTDSSQSVLLNSVSICPLKTSNNQAACVSSLPTTFPGLTGIAGDIIDTVDNSTKKTMVNAELVGTGTVVSSVSVDRKTHQYEMVLPQGNYDMYVSTAKGHNVEAHSNVFVPLGKTTGPLSAPDPFHFAVASSKTSNLSGKIVDSCSNNAISGASFSLFGPATIINTASPNATPSYVDCSTGASQEACTTCTVGTDGSIPAGCVVIGTASSTDLGDYPLPGSSSVKQAFSTIPRLTSGNNYALEAVAPGYNTELLNTDTNKNGNFECLGSGFSAKSSVVPCDFSMLRGQLNVTAAVDSAPTGNPLNALIEVEDTGTFNGENVGLVTIPVNQSSNSLSIFVPALTPTPGASPAAFYVSPPTGYDVFGSVQDLFGAAPQTTSGHTFGVASGASGAIPPPPNCGSSASVSLSPMSCTGHASITGSFQGHQPPYPDQNTLVVTSKADPANPSNLVDVIVQQVADSATFNQFAICAPADAGYVVSHYEIQPSPSPAVLISPQATWSPIQPPITFENASPAPTCKSICSDFSGNTNGNMCLLCQTSGQLPPI